MLEKLATQTRVIAPTHPGFGASPAPAAMTTVDDLSYFYLDLMEALDLRDVIVVGVSFGGWIAAEIAVKSTARMSRAGAGQRGRHQGRRPRDPRHRRHLRDHRRRLPHTGLCRSGSAPSAIYSTLPEAQLAGDRAQPRGHRALRLVALHAQSQAQGPAAPHPTFRRWCCGAASDRIVSARLRPRLCRRHSRRTFEPIAHAGHFPHLEQPEAFARRVLDFAADAARAPN